MTTSEVLKPSENKALFRAVLLVESDVLDNKWLEIMSKDLGLKYVNCRQGGSPELLRSFGPTIPILIMLPLRGLYGPVAQRKIDKVLSAWKNRPTVGILVESDGSRMMSSGRCCWITRENAKERVHQFIKRLELNSCEFFEAGRALKRNFPPPDSKSALQVSRTLLPNINVKHPGMAVAVAKVAKRRNVTGWIEISPFEAAYYYDLPMDSKRVLPLVERTFRKLKGDVDEIRRAIGADLRLHLDHAHDPNLIAAALDAGFDSVMADGSSRSLEANIRLVAEVKEQTESYGVPVEAEIGDLDSNSPRRFSYTEPEDVERFLDAVVPEYLAVCVGQDHSSDYGFERMRNSLFAIDEIDLEHLHSGRRCLFEACSIVDRELEKLGFGFEASARRTLSRISNRLFEPHLTVEDIVREAELSSCLADLRWISRLRVVSSKLRLKVEKKRLSHYDSALGTGHKDSLSAENPRLLNRMLLDKIGKLCSEKDVRLVLHGGSSIDQHDLRTLSPDVGRVNFGTNAFISFAGAALSCRPNYNGYESRSDLAAVLRDEAKGWHDWLDESPPFLKAFELSLEKEFFNPLQEAYEVSTLPG